MSMDRLIEITFLFGGIGIAIGLLIAIIKTMRDRILNWLMRTNKNYIEKHKNKFIRITNNIVILRSGPPTFRTGEWILESQILIMKPDEKRDPEGSIKTILLSDIVKIEIEPDKSFWHGNFYFLNIWHKDSILNDTPLEHRPSTFYIPFLPLCLEAAEEIVRRVNDSISKNK